MKKFMASVLAAAMIMGAGTAISYTGADTAITANAATEGKYESLTYYNFEDYIEILSYENSVDVTALEIPAEIEGLPVTAIREGAFEGATALESVVVPKGITRISDRSFSNCTSLKSISLPSTLKIIGSNAFSNCISLEKIEIPNGTTELRNNAFSGCVSLRNVVINNGITELEQQAFEDCKITTLYLPKSVTSMYYDPFANGSVQEIYYAGSPEQWALIDGSDKEIFENTTLHFGAENFEGPLTPDVNRDGAVDASDASCILAYYAYTMTGGKGTIEEYVASLNS